MAPWKSRAGPSNFRAQERCKFDDLAASDALLLGRVTYEGFAAAWRCPLAWPPPGLKG